MASTAVRPSCDRLVRQHGLADHVADGVNGRIVRLQLLVHLDEPARTDLHSRLVQPWDFGVGLASDGHEHAIEHFLAFFHVGSFERGADAAAFVFHRSDGGVEQDSVEHLFQPLVQREHQIAIRAG